MQKNPDTGNVKGALTILGTILGALALDRITKIFFMAGPNIVRPFILSPLLDITEHKNFGLIANTPVPRWLIIGFTSFIILGIAYRVVYLFRSREMTEALPLALILGGAIGNLWDRIMYTYVFDWILLFQRSVINIADITIAIGILWYIAQKYTRPRLDNDNRLS